MENILILTEIYLPYVCETVSYIILIISNNSDLTRKLVAICELK